jgi:hypothetical protein
MFAGKMTFENRRWGRRIGIAAALMSMLTTQNVRGQNNIERSMAVTAPQMTLACAPCILPAQQKTQVRFSAQIAARVAEAGNFPALQLARVVPGKTPAVLGVMSRESVSGSMATYSLTVPFVEQPGSFSVAVFMQPASNAAMLSTSLRSVSAPVQITVQQGSTNGGSGWSSLLSGIVGSLINSVSKNQGSPAGTTNPPTTVTNPPATPTNPPATATNVPTVVRGPGLTFNLPQGFHFHGEIADAGGPVSLRNFDQYLGGGVVPQGGSEIEITSVPAGATSPQTLLREETQSQSSQGTTVDTLPAQIASYTDAFAAGFSYDSQAAYVMQDGRIYKFFLTYRSGDAGAAGYRQAFSTVLNTTHFNAR